MAVITDIADAVVAELNGATFSQPVSAVRQYLPKFDLPEMQTLHVTVVPKAVVLATSDRARGQGDYSIDVAVQKKFETGDNAELDALPAIRSRIGRRSSCSCTRRPWNLGCSVKRRLANTRSPASPGTSTSA